MILETNSPQEMFSAGRQLGEKAFPGQEITLTGELGVGKTVFTQGLAKGLGIEEPVNSPTFTIVQVYDEGRLPLFLYGLPLHSRQHLPLQLFYRKKPMQMLHFLPFPV